MSLSSLIDSLAARIAAECKSIRSAIAGKADDSAVVHLAGAETISGAKTFGAAPSVPVGTAAAHPVRRDDARLSDARTPSAHASTHASGGSDPITPASIGAQPAGSYQPLDADLTTIAGLAPTNGQLLRRVAGAWAAATLTAADVGAAPTTRAITAGTGLTGGGDLSADRTLAVAYGTTAGTAAQGNDIRLSDARTPLAHTHAATDVTSGMLAIARVPTGTTSTTVALGNHTHAAAAPAAHAATHASGGSDRVTPASIGAAPSGPIFMARQTVSQSCPSGALTKVTFTTEDIDTHNGHSTSTNTSRWTCPSGWGGWYRVAGMTATDGTTAARTMSLIKNNVEIAAGDLRSATSLGGGVNRIPFPSFLVQLAVNDYLELGIYVEATCSTIVGGPTWSWFAIEYVSP